jgi:hypothetical protein
VWWRPALTFYENRTHILRTFEGQRILRAFRFADNEIAAQLFDSRDRLTVGQSGLSLMLDDPRSDSARAWTALEEAFTTVNPADPRGMQVSLKHLVPLRLDFQEAVARGYGTVLGSLGTTAVRFGDWALLVDIALSGDAPAQGQIEFGIVHREEAHARLSGEVGRTVIDDEHPGISSDSSVFPAVSLYSHFWVQQDARTWKGPTFLESARAFWDRARQEADLLVESLHAMFENADNREQNTG